MEKIKIGVIGTGYLGKFHAQKYAQMEDVELLGVVDIDLERAKEIAKPLGCKAYDNPSDLFGKVDAVSIVTPTPLHHKLSMEFIKHNADVLIEKPMTTTLNEADEIIDLSNQKDRIIQVGQLERFNPAVVALKDIVHKPMFIESHRLSIYKGRGVDVSVVLDLMIHDIDIILNFVKSDIKTIHAAGIPVVSKHVDIANARLEFMSGCVANVTASRISAKNQRKLRMFQRDAYISVDFADHDITVIKKDSETAGDLIPGMNIEKLKFDQTDALEEELKAFVSSVRNRKPSEVSGQVGRRALAVALDVMDQIQRSCEKYWNVEND